MILNVYLISVIIMNILLFSLVMYLIIKDIKENNKK